MPNSMPVVGVIGARIYKCDLNYKSFKKGRGYGPELARP